MCKRFIWLSAFLLALVIGQPAFACPTDKNQAKHCNCSCNCNQNKSSDKLSLTDEQKIKIKTIRLQAHKALKANYQELKTLRAQINALGKADKIDEAKLESLINQRNKVQTTMLKSHVMMRHQIYSLLTEKQKNQYQEMKKKEA